MYRASRCVVLLAVTLSLWVQVVAAGAAAAPAGWKSVSVTLQSEQQQSMLLVSGELPDGSRLPAQAELAVPAGTQMQWIGEILGGDPAQDPPLKYTKSSSNGMDVYRFTLTKARIAQVEGTVPYTTSFDGTNYVTGLKWTAWQAVPEVRISHRIPQASQIVQAADGATVEPGPTGYSFYTKTVKAPKAGEVLDLSFSYTLPAAGAATGTSGTGSDTLVLVVIMLAVLGGFGLLFVNVNRKISAKAALREPVETGGKEVVATAAAPAAPKRAKGARKPEPVVEAPPKRRSPVIPTLMIVGVFVAGFTIAGARGTSAAVVNGKISRNFGAASACQSTSIPFTANQGVDIAKQGDDLLKVFEGMDGVGEISIDLAQSKIDLGWCESSQSEESMRQALNGSGLITLGQSTAPVASVPATATIDASGKKQTVDVDTSSGTFAPAQVVLKANVPAEISFGSAAGCITEVVMADLGINQDLSKGPATVKLPALKPGTYAFACAMGHQSGQLIVQ